VQRTASHFQGRKRYEAKVLGSGVVSCAGSDAGGGTVCLPDLAFLHGRACVPRLLVLYALAHLLPRLWQYAGHDRVGAWTGHAGVSLESGRAGGSGLRDSVFANADDLAAAGPLQLGTAIQRPLVMGVFAADGGKLLGAEPFVVWIGNRPVKEIFHIAEGKPQPQQAFFISWKRSLR